MSDARILERGYRRYDGERLGVPGAMRSLVRHSVQRALGLRRTFWAKILPIASIAIAYVPAIVFVGLVAVVPRRVSVGIVPDYSDYYGFISAAIVVFSAFVAPEVLCTDRRTGMLGLYLASPLTRRTYLLSKVMAVTSVLAAVTLGPPLLMLIAFTLQGRGPSGLDGWLLVFVRIVAAGTVVAVLHAAISLAVSSLTDRRAVASAGVVLTLLVSSVIAESLVNDAGANEYLRLFDLLGLPFLLVNHIYGRPMVDVTMSTTAIVAAYLAWTALAAGVVWWRYQRIAVTR